MGSDGSVSSIERILSELQSSHSVPEMKSSLRENREMIDDCFSGITMEQIISRLEAQNQNSWAQKTLKTLATKCPTSLKVWDAFKPIYLIHF